MPGLIQGSQSEIIGGPAAMFLAPSTYPMPSRISEIVNLSSYAANTSYGFVAVGYTREGVTMTREVSTQQTRTDETGLLKIYPIDYKSTIKAVAKQASQTNKIRLQQMVAGTPNGASELVTYAEAAAFLSTWRLGVVHQDENGKFHARVFPSAQWDGASQAETFRRGQNDEIEFSFVGLPSTEATGPNGQPSDRIDFDQP